MLGCPTRLDFTAIAAVGIESRPHAPLQLEADGAPQAGRGHCGADRPAAAGVCLGVRFAAQDKAIRPSPPCVHGASRGPPPRPRAKFVRTRAVEGDSSAGLNLVRAEAERSANPFAAGPRRGSMADAVSASSPSVVWQAARDCAGIGV